MPYDDPDPEDPQMLVGVELPGSEKSICEMAYVIAEEFSRLGYSREMLLRLFRKSCYGGPHKAWRVLGEDRIAKIIDECLGIWGQGGTWREKS